MHYGLNWSYSRVILKILCTCAVIKWFQKKIISLKLKLVVDFVSYVCVWCVHVYQLLLNYHFWIMTWTWGTSHLEWKAATGKGQSMRTVSQVKASFWKSLYTEPIQKCSLIFYVEMLAGCLMVCARRTVRLFLCKAASAWKLPKKVYFPCSGNLTWNFLWYALH